jgi:putative SOS response-associated peptidase YedK
MGVAGLWERWAKDGAEIISFTLMSVNANSHALLTPRRDQHNGIEKRTPVILGEGAYSAWLSARPEKAREFHAGGSRALVDGKSRWRSSDRANYFAHVSFKPVALLNTKWSVACSTRSAAK